MSNNKEIQEKENLPVQWFQYMTRLHVLILNRMPT